MSMLNLSEDSQETKEEVTQKEQPSEKELFAIALADASSKSLMRILNNNVDKGITRELATGIYQVFLNDIAAIMKHQFPSASE